MADLTAERLRELLDYDPGTGAFSWKVLRGSVKAGAVAGTTSGSAGYCQIGLYGGRYLAHRLAWLYVYGVWPSNNIDHRNGVRTDNRIDNLREASGSINSQNLRKAHADNGCTELLGVNMRGKRYQAQIKVNGKQLHIGYYATPELAHAAYLEKKRLLHPGCTI